MRGVMAGGMDGCTYGSMEWMGGLILGVAVLTTSLLKRLSGHSFSSLILCIGYWLQ